MLRKVFAAAVAALALFHVWIFAGQAIAGQLSDPGLIVRWALAGALLGSLAGLYRRGVSLFRGHRAVAIWLLAALLHGPAVGARLEALEIPAIPVVEVLAPLGIAAAAAIGFILLIAFARAASSGCAPRPAMAAPRPFFGALPRGSHHAFAPRPPPAV